MKYRFANQLEKRSESADAFSIERLMQNRKAVGTFMFRCLSVLVYIIASSSVCFARCSNIISFTRARSVNLSFEEKYAVQIS